MKQSQRRNEKVGRIILAKVLAMPMERFRRFAAVARGETAAAPSAWAADSRGGSYARVAVVNNRPLVAVADPAYDKRLSVAGLTDVRKICARRWINTRNRLSRHILNGLLRCQGRYWLTGKETDLLPLTQARFLERYPSRHLDASRLSRLLSVLTVVTPQGRRMLLRRVFISNRQHCGYAVREILNETRGALTDGELRERLRARGIMASIRTVCEARRILRIPGYRERNGKGYEGNCLFSGSREFADRAEGGYPEAPGVYELSIGADIGYRYGRCDVIYLGASKCLRRRLANYQYGKVKNLPLFLIINGTAVKVRYFLTDDHAASERRMLANFRGRYGELPVANVLGGGSDGKG